MLAAIDGDDRSGYVAGTIADQKRRQRAYIFDSHLTGTSQCDTACKGRSQELWKYPASPPSATRNRHLCRNNCL